MSSFEIQGGKPLHGSVRIGGAKNASYKIMIASLLAQSESRLLNFSHISDVEAVTNIIGYLGGKTRNAGERAIFIDPSTLSDFQLKAEDGVQGRFSTMFIPVLLAKFGLAVVPAPGGDKIGKRPLDRHFDGLEALGARVIEENGVYRAELIDQAKGLRGVHYHFDKNTHTGTETLLLAAATASGTTILENAALEPEIDDLISFLNKMGARITRPANRVIKIEGVNRLEGAIHAIMPDRNEAVSYACAAIATQGDVIIENARRQHLTAFLNKLDEIGAGYESGDYGIRFFYKGPLQATTVTTEIEPGFMTDWQPLWATLATQCYGESVIHETIYPSRFQYAPELIKMGAKIEYFNPEVSDPESFYNFDWIEHTPSHFHAIRVLGPAALQPTIVEVHDLRHGATLILAALVAQGTSIIKNVEHVDRGYESLDVRLKSMGATIKRIV